MTPCNNCGHRAAAYLWTAASWEDAPPAPPAAELPFAMLTPARETSLAATAGQGSPKG